MLRKIDSFLILVIVAVTVVVSGCRDDDEKSLQAGMAGISVSACSLSFEELSDDSVLMQIGSRRLTKKGLSDIANLFVNLQCIRNLSCTDADRRRIRKNELKRHFRGFVTKALLLNKAESDGIEIGVEAIAASERRFVKSYGRSKQTYEDLKSELPAECVRTLAEVVKDDAVVRTVLALESEGRLEISEQEIDAVIEETKKLNEAAEKALIEMRERARVIRERLDKGENFHKLADEVSDTASEDGPACIWGTFTVADVPYPEMVKQIEKLDPWQWFGPLELDDAIHFVRVTKRTRVGLINGPEDEVELARIVVKLPLFYEAGSREAIRQDTAKQKLKQIEVELLNELRKKVVVCYPSGTNLWRAVSAQRAGENAFSSIFHETN